MSHRKRDETKLSDEWKREMKDRPADDSTRLYLIRHAATSANEQRPYILQGRSVNHSLSETGRSQASALGEFLSAYSVDHVYASPLKRAMETAEAVARHHQHSVQALDDMVECDVGEWEKLDWGTIMERYPEHYHAFMENPAETPYLGGESYGDVLNRVKPVLASLVKKHLGETVVVVGHNVVNRAYLAEFLNTPLRLAKNIKQSNTGINVLRYRDGEISLTTLNAVFHLP